MLSFPLLYVISGKVDLNLETLEEDVYTLDVGIRTVRKADNDLFINEKPFYLQGILPRQGHARRFDD